MLKLLSVPGRTMWRVNMRIIRASTSLFLKCNQEFHMDVVRKILQKKKKVANTKLLDKYDVSEI